jgi:hypothetical protein
MNSGYVRISEHAVITIKISNLGRDAKDEQPNPCRKKPPHYPPWVDMTPFRNYYFLIPTVGKGVRK